MGEDPFETGRRQANPNALGVGMDLDQPAAAKSPAHPQPSAGTPEPEETAGSPAPAQEMAKKPAPAQEAAKEPPPAATTRKKAEVGAGKKGHYGGAGIIKTPVSVYFRASERIIFNIQIPKEMQLYKSINGKAPQSHEEFMEKIIKPARIDLPTLLPGERYIYDPQKEELFIEQPARQ
jgi:hypothetical protein